MSRSLPDRMVVENQLHKLRTYCTIMDALIDKWLSPAGLDDNNQSVFEEPEEVQADALQFLAIEAKVVSRELYDLFTGSGPAVQS